MSRPRPDYHGYRFPPQIISHAVWLYHRFSLSFRDVEDLLAERGVSVTYETIRQWCLMFGLDYARRHCQVDVEQAGAAPDEAMTHSSASDAGHLSPDTAGPCSQEPMMDGPQEVAADTKEILDGGRAPRETVARGQQI